MSAVYCSSAVQLVEVHIQYMTVPLSVVFKKSGVHATMSSAYPHTYIINQDNIKMYVLYV
jgi:hypothetical protein